MAEPPTDPWGQPPVTFGGIPWDWRTLLRNRPLDVWMHEQDIRRAIGRPGGMDSAAAKHTADYLADSLPLVVAKRVAALQGAAQSAQSDASEPKATQHRTSRQKAAVGA